MLVVLLSFFYEFVRLCLTSKVFALIVLGAVCLQFFTNTFEKVYNKPVPPAAMLLHAPAVSHSIAPLASPVLQSQSIPFIGALYAFVRQGMNFHAPASSTDGVPPSGAIPTSSDSDKKDPRWILESKNTVFLGTSITAGLIALWAAGNYLLPESQHEKQPVRTQDMKQAMLEKLQHTVTVFNPEVKISDRELEQLSTFLLHMQQQTKKQSISIRCKNFIQAWTKYFIARYTQHKTLLSL